MTSSGLGERSPLLGSGELTPNVVETHSALVFFVEDRVYKLKKGADLGFLDHRTRRARRQACEQEVELNSRLAADVYLGVFDVIDPAGRLCDHLVGMRRLPEQRRLRACIERDEDLDGTIRAISHAIAALHLASPRSRHHDNNASAEAVLARWSDGFDRLRRVAAEVPGAARLTEIESLVGRYLAGRTDLFATRIKEGRVRDGHGDLQADDIFVLDDGPRILDCVEFGEDYRWGDILSDVAFLAMDLERLGRPTLGAQLLALHREHTADRWPSSLAHHYIAYRAHVRAKVVALRNVQRNEPIGDEVDRFLQLAVDHLRAGEVRLILVGGLPGTGKSTVAAALGEGIDAVVLRTDELRKATSGLDRSYNPEAISQVYSELLAQAEQLLSHGESVILDATWSDAHQRQLARDLAATTSSSLSELRCDLPAADAAQRIDDRRRQGRDPSDATAEVASAIAERFDDWPQAAIVSTRPERSTVARDALARVLDHRG